MKLLFCCMQKLLVSSFKFNKLSIFLLSPIVPFPTFFSESPFCSHIDHYYKILWSLWQNSQISLTQNRPFSPNFPDLEKRHLSTPPPPPNIHKCFTPLRPTPTQHALAPGPTVKDMTLGSSCPVCRPPPPSACRSPPGTASACLQSCSCTPSLKQGRSHAAEGTVFPFPSLFFFFPFGGGGLGMVVVAVGGGGGDWRHCILLFCFLFFSFHQHQDWPSNTWINPSKTQCQHQVWHSNTWINPSKTVSAPSLTLQHLNQPLKTQCQHQVWHSNTWINPWRHSVSTKSDTPTPESIIARHSVSTKSGPPTLESILARHSVSTKSDTPTPESINTSKTASVPSLTLQHLNQSTLARQHQCQVWHSNTWINPSKTQCQHQVWHSQHLNQSTLARHSVSTKSDTPTPESIQARHSISTKSDTPTPESINTSKTVSAPSLALQHLNQS